MTARPLSVGELSRRITLLLEEGVGEVLVEGEASGVRIPRSGHCYFQLKDEQGSINAVCFRSALQRCAFQPADGMRIEVRGRVTAYAARSEYQIVVDRMREAGLGELMRKFMELKEKLKAQGLFDAEKKRPIPRLPRAIGIVTSPSGAALRDILNILARRGRGIELFLAPAAVQGAGAPREIVHAIELLARHGRAEAIIVGRGGGSLQDLWAFNDERVARAIAASPIPVISAVGHETDTTLADYAADLRAPTPSAAAELVTAHYGELADAVAASSRRLHRAGRAALGAARDRLTRCKGSWGMRRPLDRLGQSMQRADDLGERLARASMSAMRRRMERLETISARLRKSAPLARLSSMRERTARLGAALAAAGPARWRPRIAHRRELTLQFARRLQTALGGQAKARQLRLQALGERLGAAGPPSILARGYSIVTRGGRGRLVTAPEQVKAGETVRIRSAGGEWRAAALPQGDDLFDNAE